MSTSAGSLPRRTTTRQSPDNEHDANQLLIAHAPTDLALLLEVAQTAKTVRRMHQADGAVIALYLALDALEKAE